MPDNALFATILSIDKIEIYVEKRLNFSGHPPAPMNIYHARTYMGIAYKIIDQSLVFATYGEWFSRIEGGADIRLLINFPKYFHVKKDKFLSGGT